MTNLPAQAVKYIARPFVIIPHDEDTFALFLGYSGNREYVGDFSPTALLEYFREDFAHRRQQSQAQRAREEARRPPNYDDLTLDIDLNELGLASSFNIDLNL